MIGGFTKRGVSFMKKATATSVVAFFVRKLRIGYIINKR